MAKKGGDGMGGIAWFLFWQLGGLTLARRVFRTLGAAERLLLGSVCGSVLAMWTPIPFSFLFGFSLAAHLCAAAAGLGLIALLFVRRAELSPLPRWSDFDLPFLALLLPFLALCVILLLSHTLREENGALYTGQCCFGDMAMHLGFISSMAAQGRFPPEYSILPGARLCYPFLCDSVSASLLLLGTPLRAAYLLPAVFAFLQVFCGFYLLGRAACRSAGAPLLAFVLFFLNGGLGTLYFFRKYRFSELFFNFYKTPTNLPAEGVRWVNVIADMLIPQRATLFGWAVLFAILLLLYRAVFERDETLFLPAGILGGLLVMIHTHSFLALGLIAAVWLGASAVRDRFSRGWLVNCLRFGLSAVLLALPQLMLWTFHSVGGNEQFLRLHFDWVNEGRENWLWFWLKNVGPLFLLAPLAFARSDRKGRVFALPVPVIFLLCECLAFQPNVYDNNKLLYVAYALLCLLTADRLAELGNKLRSRPLRAALLSVLLVLCVNAAALTLARELISGLPGHSYRLFSADDTAAAAFIREETPPDALFLTESNHNNAVAALTGRSIVCGSPSYLFYHGLDYAEALEDARRMLAGGESFERLRAGYGVDYVYIGEYERGNGSCCESYFAAHYPLVFSSGRVSIYRID